jgi:hypothetical protein
VGVLRPQRTIKISMSLLNALLSADLACALTWLLCATAIDVALTLRETRANPPRGQHYALTRYAAKSLLRALAITGTVLIAYPTLYGAHVAPTVATLLQQSLERDTWPLNLAFVGSLLIAAIVASGTRSAWLAPVHSLLATAMVFAWYTNYLGATSASCWPNVVAGVAVCLMAVLGFRVGTECGVALGRWMNRRFDRVGLERALPDTLAALAQLPVVLYYGLTLGQQIAI